MDRGLASMQTIEKVDLCHRLSLKCVVDVVIASRRLYHVYAFY